ncbi:MAG: hypothetical protein M3404_11260 [Actinomycetota bacterium]|nr:hypothetical protein [Actinomycetota bacterium]
MTRYVVAAGTQVNYGERLYAEGEVLEADDAEVAAEVARAYLVPAPARKAK